MTRVRWMIAAALGAAFLSAPNTAAAQGPSCGPRDALLAALAEGYGERPVGRGVSAAGGLVEILASPKGTWTVVVTVPGGGPTCIVSSGEGWRNLSPKPEVGPPA